jgi:hypothetical protein
VDCDETVQKSSGRLKSRLHKQSPPLRTKREKTIRMGFDRIMRSRVPLNFVLGDVESRG